MSIFYSDQQAKSLLMQANGYRYVNVYENTFGDQYFGGARCTRKLCEDEPGKRGRRGRPLYRIVVKAKRP